MANIEAITFQNHSSKFWRRNDNLKFASKDSLSRITLAELPQAIMSLPVCFVMVEDQPQLVMLQGLESGSNLAVNEHGGWLFDYIPAVYRAYPFLLADGAEDNKILCINTDSGLILDDNTEEAFFEDDGTPTKNVSELLDFLSKLYINGLATQNACNLLQKHDLIEPWPISIHDGEEEQKINGLFRIQEESLAQLTPEVLVQLRDAGALSLAYAQLFSMQRIGRLKTKMENRGTNNGSADLEGLNIDFDSIQDNGSISFDNL